LRNVAAARRPRAASNSIAMSIVTAIWTSGLSNWDIDSMPTDYRAAKRGR
jgi:hypothetical protein